MKKQTICVILSLLLLMILLPIRAQAAVTASGNCGIEGQSNLSWVLEDGILTISGSGEMDDLDSENSWMPYASEITEVRLPEGLTTLSSYAFAGCSSLRQLDLPDTLEQIEYHVLENSGVTEVTLPRSVCNLWSEALAGMNQLKTIRVDPANQNFCVVDQALFSADRKILILHPVAAPITTYTVPDGTEMLAGYAFADHAALESIQLPESLVTIDRYCFQNDTALREIVFPKSVETVSSGVFTGCTALSKVTLPEGLLDIFPYSFENCSALEDIILPSSVTYISNDSFTGSGLYNNPENWENDIFYLDQWAICADQEFTGTCRFRDGTVHVSAGCFRYCEGLEEVILPDSLRTLGGCAFSDCASLRKVVFSSALMEMEDSAFANCTALKSAEIPGSVLTIQSRCFLNCTALEKVTILPGCDTICWNAFADCTALREISIPESIRVMEEDSFSGCTGITDIYYGGTAGQWDRIQQTDNLFPPDAEIHFEKGSALSGICGADGQEDSLTWTLDEAGVLTVSGTGRMCDEPDWYGFSDMIQKAVIEDGVTSIGYHAFCNCLSMTEISIADSVEEIGSAAFQNCAALKSIQIPIQVETIDSYAFWGCASLEAFRVSPSHPTMMVQDGVLYSKDGRILQLYPCGRRSESFVIPRGVREIQYNAFDKVPYLRAIGIPTDVEKLNDIDRHSNPFLYDLYYEGSKHQWSRMLSEADMYHVVCHCDWTYGTSMPVTLWPAYSDNSMDNSYTVWSSCVKSYMEPNDDGTLTRVEEIDGIVVAETYDGSFHLLDQRIVTLCAQELPMFGGFYSSGDYNFLVFGQDNLQERNSREVIRVVKYSKDWERLSSGSIYGDDVYQPFHAGSLRMAHKGNDLYILTAYQMFISEDGLRHQGDLLLHMDIPSCEVRSLGCYASHSFNQYILEDQGTFFMADHGDAGPRGIAVSTFEDLISSDFLQYRSIVEVPGESGDNTTKLSFGGMEAIGDRLCIAGDIVDPDAPDWDDRITRNIFLSIVPRDLDDYNDRFIYLTHYPEGDVHQVFTPQFLKLDSHRMMVLWPELIHTDDGGAPLCYQIVDVDGTLLTPILSTEEAEISDCKPIVFNGSVCWYFTASWEEGTPEFCTVSIDSPEKVNVFNHYQLERPKPPKQTFEDVYPDDYYFDAVNWAVENGITTGTAPGRFSPNAVCTRAHAVTFLWAQAGKPEPTSQVNPFTDVSSEDYFYKAVLWAVENQITSGTSASTFGPNDRCTRGQIVTFLWAAAERPAADSSSNPFTDVRESDYFCQPVLWAVDRGITAGVSAHSFGPNHNCTRGQIVTFLYRYAGN